MRLRAGGPATGRLFETTTLACGPSLPERNTARSLPTNRAARTAVDEADQLDHAAGSLRRHALDEVVGSERAALRSRRIARLSQFIDYAFFLAYALFAIRFFLAMAGAMLAVFAATLRFREPAVAAVEGSTPPPSHCTR